MNERKEKAELDEENYIMESGTSEDKNQRKIRKEIKKRKVMRKTKRQRKRTEKLKGGKQKNQT